MNDKHLYKLQNDSAKKLSLDTRAKNAKSKAPHAKMGKKGRPELWSEASKHFQAKHGKPLPNTNLKRHLSDAQLKDYAKFHKGNKAK